MRRKYFIAFALFAAVAGMSACEFSFSTARIVDAQLSKEVNENKEAVNPTTTFSSTDPIIHAVVTLANAPDSTKVKAKWMAVKVEGMDPNKGIGEIELETQGKNIVDFTYTAPSSGLPPGNYKVEIYLNSQDGKANEPDRTLSFTVAQGNTPAASSGVVAGDIQITDAIITLTPDGEAVTSVPPDASVIYGQAKLSGDAAGRAISAKWVIVQAEGQAPGTVIASVAPITLKTGQNIYTTDLHLNTNLPTGEYRVDFYLNYSTTSAFSASFTVPE